MATKKKNKYLESISKSASKIESNKEKYAQKEQYDEDTLFGSARSTISENRLRESNNIGESPYKNLSIIRANRQKEEEEAQGSIFDIARNNISSGAASYNRAEKSYMDSLPNDAYRFAYQQSKNTDGVYVSPYFSKGIEGKEKLTYNNDEWNRLSEGERKKYLEWAQDEIDNGKKNDVSSNKYLNYAKRIIREANGGKTIAGSVQRGAKQFSDSNSFNKLIARAVGLDKVADTTLEGTFDADREKQIMFQMLPDEVKQELLNEGASMTNDIIGGLKQIENVPGVGKFLAQKTGIDRLDDTSKAKAYLEQYYSPEDAEMLIKYGQMIGSIRDQQERNERTAELMKNPIYATVGAPLQQIATDLVVKPIAGATDFVSANLEADKGIRGVFNPYETAPQKLSQEARYINESVNEGLGAGGRFVYGTAVSAAESTLRTYLATTGAAGISKMMPFVNAETASKVLLTGMMSTAVFNDDLNENIQKGMPLEDAVSSAMAHSIFESLFEEISLDKLGYFQEAPVLRSKKEFVKQLMKAGFVEGSEEAFTDIANELYDHYVGNYDYSEYKAFKDNYLAENPDATDAEIWWNFTKQFSWQVAQSFAGGALSSFALSSTKNMSALHRGEIYVQNGRNVSDADYNRMNAFVEEMAAVNPNIANQLAEATEGGEDARRGFVKMVTDEYSEKFNKEIEKAKTKDKLNVVMNNVNTVLHGAISEDTFNTYNAKLVELGETPADYNTFVQNRQRGGETTFSDLAYGRGDNAIQRNIVEASKSIAETRENANMSESERETAINELRGKVEQNVKKAEDMVARYAQMGKALDSPEVRQFESVLGLENMAQIYSAGKIASENKMLPSVTGRGGKLYAVDKNSEGARAIFGENIDHIQDVPFNELQKTTAYSLGKVLAKMTGVDVAFYKSDRQKVQNGAFHRNSNTIYIDVNAGVSGADAAVGEVFSHELTHWIRSKNEEGYQRLLDFVKADLGDSYDSMLKDHMDRLGLDEDVAGEEIVAEACQRMLKDSETFKRYAATDTEGAKTLLQRLVDFVRELRDAFKGSLNNEATRMISDLEGLQQTWETALQEAIGEQTAMEGGIDVETFDDTAVRDSIRTVLDEKQQERVSKMLQEKLGVDKKTADEYIENEQTIASLIFDNIGFLDYKPDDRYEAIKKNSDYPQGTVDMTNLCRKRAIFTQIFDSLQEHFPNRLFNAMDIADIREVLKTNGYQVACALCFVEDRRQRVGEIAESFIERLKESNGKTLTVVNSKGETKELFMTKDLANTDVARRAGFKYKDAIKVTDKYIPNQYDLVTYEGFKALSENHPQVAVAFTRANNYLGMSSARLVEGRAEYKRDILKYTPTQVKRINNKGGLRIFSFSDFEAVHLLDICQVIMDASVVGLKIQAYTKVPAFAKLVANTGIKLNRSLIASGKGFKVNPDGSRTLTYDTHEGINIDDPDFFDSSDNPNIGNILVGISNEHIRLAMEDDFVDYIIPFHSNQGKNVLAVKGISHWTNYKEYQRERYADGRKGARDVNIYTQVIDKYHPTNKVEFVEAFLKECKAQGKIPRFDQFLNKVNGEYVYTPGYEKLLLDFKLFDKQGNILPQNTVNPNIDMEVATRILNDEVKGAEKREQVSGKIIKELEKKYEARNSSRDSERIAEESLENANDDEKEILSGNDIRYSQRVTDQKTLDFLNNQEYITTYRSFQLINGGLYSPMNQGREGYKTELDVWEQSTEITDFDEAVRNKVLVPQKNGGYKYNLKSGNNTTSGKNRTTAAAYNPYLHSSNSVMNDQFSAAYDRPNLVVVECRVPKSEASRPYKAKNATDPVGWKEWKSGKASTELAKNGGEARGVFLSRWMKAVRILPYSEVAQMYKDALEGTDITIAWNVVPPGLRQELEKIGVPIDYSYKNGNVTFENMFPDEAYKANGVRNSSRDSERDSEYMEAVERKDRKAEQKLVDEAAIEAGAYTGLGRSKKPLAMYHGTKSEFNSFDIEKGMSGTFGLGHYFSTEQSTAKSYGKRIIKSYLISQKVAAPWTHNITAQQVRAFLDAIDREEQNTTMYFTDSTEEWVEKHNDATIIRDLLHWAIEFDNGMTHNDIMDAVINILGVEAYEPSNSVPYIVVFNNAAIKSADPVTYDDNGNVIPLSERFNKENEDIRYASRDSSGRELTEAQQKYFKDSKIRDDEGNLKVMFHGTEADFNIFDFSQGGKNGTAEGFGIYLTDNKDVSKAYGGRIIESYVNITKPAMYNKKSITSSQLVKLIEATAKNQAQRMIDEEGYGTMNDALKDTWISNYTYTYDKPLASSYREVANSIIRMSDNDRDIIQEVMAGMAIRDYDAATDFYKVLQDVLGFDGFVTEWKNNDTGERSEIVLAFNSNQIKNVDNLNPTSSDDIRYSLRDLANSESEIIVNALANDEALVESLGAREAVETYTREYKKLTDMEATATQITKDLKKKGKTPIEREKLLHKLVRIERAISDRTATLSEMRNSAALRTLLESEWEKRDAMVSVGKADERLVPKKLLEEKYGAALEEWTENRKRSAERNKAAKKAIRDRQKSKHLKENIIKKTRDIMKRIATPTEKKHVPTVLVKPISELIEAIDYWTPKEGRPVTKTSEQLWSRFQNFKNAVEELQTETDKAAEAIKDRFDPDFLDYVNQISKYITEQGIDNVNDMNVENLEALDSILTELNHIIKTANDMFSRSRFKTADELRQVTKEDLNKRKGLKEGKSDARGNFVRRTNAGMADAYAWAEYAGEGAKEIVNMLSKAYNRKINLIRQATEYTEDVLKPVKKDLKKWEKDEKTFKLESGKELKLNVRTMLDIYLLSKREQGYQHLISDSVSERLEKEAARERGEDVTFYNGGGIRVKDRKGKFRTLMKFTQSDLNQVIDYLKTVPNAIEVAEKLQKFISTEATAWGNKASNDLYGIIKYTEENYWPISTSDITNADNGTGQSVSTNVDMNKIKNYGFTKALQQNAKNGVDVDDFLNVFSKHIDEMSSYGELLPALTDAMRWWNSRTDSEDNRDERIKDLMASKIGTDMANVFNSIIIGLNGGTKTQDSLASWIRSLRGKVKAAAIAFNPRVVVQQPFSYTRAAAVIEKKYLTKALTMVPAVKEAQEHSAIAWLKHQGFHSSGIGPSMKKLVTGDGTAMENLVEKTMAPAGWADDITWGTLWNAAKLKVEDTQKNLEKGSQEYFDAIEDVFNEIINRTQVVETPLTQSPWMKSNMGTLYMSFMNEPVKTYSMVMTAIDKVVRDPHNAEARRQLYNAAGTFMVSGFALALAQSLVDAARDDDKELSYWEKYVEKYKDNALDNVNPLTYLPLIKDAWSVAQGYSSKDLTSQGTNEVINATKELIKVAKGESKHTLWGQAEIMARAYSYMSGVPVSNAMRIFKSVGGNMLGNDFFRSTDYTKSELGRNVVLELRDGNTEQAEKYFNQLQKKVGEDEDPYAYISDYLAKRDDDADIGARNFLEDANSLEEYAEKIVNKYNSEYVTLDVATDSIRKAARADLKEDAAANNTKYKNTISSGNTAGTLWNGSDINRALENGDIVEAQKLIDKINAGYKKQESNTTAKTSVSNYWKPKYLASSGAERDKIARMLYSLKNNGKQMFSAKDLQKWVADANKSSK